MPPTLRPPSSSSSSFLQPSSSSPALSRPQLTSSVSSTSSSSSSASSSSSSSISTLANLDTSDDHSPNPDTPSLLKANSSRANLGQLKSDDSSTLTAYPSMITVTAINPSIPVGIPIRSNVNTPASGIGFSKKRSESRVRNLGKENVAPSVAALRLLAATAIPLRPNNINTNPKFRSQRQRSTDLSPTSPILSSPYSLLDLALSDALNEKAPSITRSNSQSYLNVLLSTPDLSDEFSLPTSPPHSSFSIRSLSSDSIPSLANDDEGSFSWSASFTPSPLRRSSSKSNKTFSPPEECILDHPLLLPELLENEEESEEEEVDPSSIYTEQQPKISGFSRRSFKSNLTASLRVLRSAARTFTSLSAPLAQPDDYLTRSILSISPQFNTDEKRPEYQDNPTPALRRYLNPSPQIVSREIGFQDKNGPIKASIQLQTYSETTVEAPVDILPIARNREVRENSDFLRVIVLEMNMRRHGKLSDTSQGKARFVLPPRQSTKLRPVGDPEHWKAIVFD